MFESFSLKETQTQFIVLPQNDLIGSHRYSLVLLQQQESGSDLPLSLDWSVSTQVTDFSSKDSPKFCSILIPCKMGK